MIRLIRSAAKPVPRAAVLLSAAGAMLSFTPGAIAAPNPAASPNATGAPLTAESIPVAKSVLRGSLAGLVDDSSLLSFNTRPGARAWRVQSLGTPGAAATPPRVLAGPFLEVDAAALGPDGVLWTALDKNFLAFDVTTGQTRSLSMLPSTLASVTTISPYPGGAWITRRDQAVSVTVDGQVKGVPVPAWQVAAIDASSAWVVTSATSLVLAKDGGTTPIDLPLRKGERELVVNSVTTGPDGRAWVAADAIPTGSDRQKRRHVAMTVTPGGAARRESDELARAMADQGPLFGRFGAFDSAGRLWFSWTGGSTGRRGLASYQSGAAAPVHHRIRGLGRRSFEEGFRPFIDSQDRLLAKTVESKREPESSTTIVRVQLPK